MHYLTGSFSPCASARCYRSFKEQHNKEQQTRANNKTNTRYDTYPALTRLARVLVAIDRTNCAERREINKTGKHDQRNTRYDTYQALTRFARVPVAIFA
jgi:hypothetical protein